MSLCDCGNKLEHDFDERGNPSLICFKCGNKYSDYEDNKKRHNEGGWIE